jgi:integrase
MWGLIGWNPSGAVVRPKLHRKEMKVLTDTQMRNLLLAAKGTCYEALLQIAVTTGLREGEILGLKWFDLDWKSRQLQVQNQVQRLKGKGIVSVLDIRILALPSTAILKLFMCCEFLPLEFQGIRQ